MTEPLHSFDTFAQAQKALDQLNRLIEKHEPNSTISMNPEVFKIENYKLDKEGINNLKDKKIEEVSKYQANNFITRIYKKIRLFYWNYKFKKLIKNYDHSIKISQVIKKFLELKDVGEPVSMNKKDPFSIKCAGLQIKITPADDDAKWVCTIKDKNIQTNFIEKALIEIKNLKFKKDVITPLQEKQSIKNEQLKTKIKELNIAFDTDIVSPESAEQLGKECVIWKEKEDENNFYVSLKINNNFLHFLFEPKIINAQLDFSVSRKTGDDAVVLSGLSVPTEKNDINKWIDAIRSFYAPIVSDELEKLISQVGGELNKEKDPENPQAFYIKVPVDNEGHSPEFQVVLSEENKATVSLWEEIEEEVVDTEFQMTEVFSEDNLEKWQEEFYKKADQCLLRISDQTG